MQKTRIPWRGIPAEGGKYGAKHVKSKAVAHGIMVLPAAADWIFICISLPAGLVRLLLHDRQKRGLFGACQLPGSLEFLALGNTFRFSAVGVLLLVGISFLLSVGFHHLLLYSSRKIKWMQSGLITPMVIPSAVIILFCQIFLDSGGMLNQWMGSKTLYLQQSPYAFWILIALYLWKNCGYCTVILLSALAGIDRAQYEAARCDGAGVWTQIWRITFPQILSSLFFSAIIAIVGVFKIFRESYLLMGEYPHESVYMLQNFINNNMETLNYQRLSAASLTFLCILMVVIILFIRFSGILEEGGEASGKKKKKKTR